MKLRNSNIELLRILAMLFIAFNHFTWMSQEILDGVTGVYRYALLDTLGLMINFGGVGDVLFFAITAWFLCAENVSIKKSCKRIWMLEQRLLFYSVGLLVLSCAFFYFIGYGELPSGMAIVASFFPFITGKWWYTTSYIVFLVLHPFVNAGLRAMGRGLHKRLIVISLVVWGVIPYFDMNMGYGIFLFLYLYALVAYFRWYRTDLLESKRRAWKALGIGFVLGFGSNIIVQFFSPAEVVGAFWMNKPRCIPSLLMAFGLFSLAVSSRDFRSRFVNRIASGTLAMYLLQGFLDPLCVWLMQDYVAGLRGFVLIGVNIVMAIGCYIVALFIDQLRQLLFGVMFRHPGKWFESAFRLVRTFAQHYGPAVMKWIA